MHKSLLFANYNCSRLNDWLLQQWWEFFMRTGPSKTNQHTLVLPPFCPVEFAEMCGSAHPEILL